MLKKIVCIYIISFSLNATEINNRVDMSIDTEGKLKISTGYLTNYLLRGSLDGGQNNGSPVFIKRNAKALNIDLVDVEWDGLFPADVSFKYPEYNKEDTTIDLSNYNYIGDGDWKNSEIIMRGANLGGMITDFPSSNEERIDTIMLFLLNTLTVAEASANFINTTGNHF